jgi:2-oxo-3-hexenedioate decarboxylase
MTGGPGDTGLDDRAATILGALDAGRPLPRGGGLDDLTLPLAYRVADRITAFRVARGERVAGVKIGFTNRRVWAGLGVAAPIRGAVYETTIGDAPATVALGGWRLPRIEPEIILVFARRPAPRDGPRQILEAVTAVALGFEIVRCPYPDWSVSAAEAVLAGGLHAALVVGERVPVAGDRERWLDVFANGRITLSRNGAPAAAGDLRDVMDGGPLEAVVALLDLAGAADAWPEGAGSLVSTGTIVPALDVAAGETWRVAFDGDALPAVSVRFTDDGA